MRTRIHEQLGGVAEIFRQASAPRAAVYEYIDRRIGALGQVNIKPFDGCRAIRKTPRRADAYSHGFAVGRIALDDLLQVRCISGPIVSRVKFELIHLEPHRRAFDARGLGRGLLRERGIHRDYRAGRCCAQQCPASHWYRLGFIVHAVAPLMNVGNILFLLTILSRSARASRVACQMQFHTLMRRDEAQILVKTNSAGARLVRRELHHVTASLLRAFDGPLE